jgi:hypothetical protein
MINTSKKLRIARDDIKKDVKKYVGLWVAVDDKDRIIALDKDKSEVFKKALDFACFAECSFRIYEIYKPYERQMIKSLLDYAF